VVHQARGRDQFHQVTQIHHRRALTEIGDEVQVVGDEQDRQVVLSAQAHEQLHDAALAGQVQGRDRLVGDEQARAHHPGPGPSPLC